MSTDHKHCCCARGRDGSCGKQDKSCGGCAGSGCAGGCRDRVIYITEDEKAFLLKLAEIPFLPLARFVMKRSDSDDLVSVAMAPVYLSSKDDSDDTVKKTGAILQSLEDKYLITLDYDLPLRNGDYSMYEKSRLYRDFCETMQKGIHQDDATYNLPVLQYGSMALTSLGQDALDSLE